MTLRTVGRGEFDSIAWLLSGPSVFATVDVPIPPTDPSPFGDEMPLGQGQYLLETVSLGGDMFPGDYRIADYTVSVTVEDTLTPIPLPAAAGLLAASLVALGALRRRRA